MTNRCIKWVVDFIKVFQNIVSTQAPRDEASIRGKAENTPSHFVL
jgi:hypothetical protein